MATPSDASAATTPEGITLARLDNQALWYGGRSKRAQRLYKWTKAIVIAAAALIPFLTGRTFQHKEALIGGLGVLITILEGILQLNQYQQIWMTYRATSEALTHEKFLFLAQAGPYAAEGVNRPVLLAERIEALMSQENTRWVSLQEQSGKQGAKGQT